ncbi:MAG: lactate dehydrogenase-like 2-hydroxyacid dehydrogenase [Paracoccaceae bacterium]|jgi:lactate dehydrogenase-like 2-hydroxyacid dehydrogenase
MSKPKILLSRRWPSAVEVELEKHYDVTLNPSDTPMTVGGFRSALQNFDAILPTVTDKMSADVFDDIKPRTKIIGNFGVGYTHIDIPAASAAGIAVTNTPGVLSDCTADLTMTLMLMAARRAGEGERELRAGKWSGWHPTHLQGSRMTGKTLGIIGYGRIGREVAKRAHFGFGMKILAQNRSKIENGILIRTSAQQVTSISELLEKADFVSLHCPGGAENHHLIGAEQFKQMKSTAFLINTARGEVVDEKALVRALKTGGIAGAGLDVFDGEPKVNQDLIGCENAVLLPHLGSATRETREAMGFRVLDNLSDFFGGWEPRDLVA